MNKKYINQQLFITCNHSCACSISVCEAPFNIENAAIIVPEKTSLNRSDFVVRCMDGYYASEEKGIMLCGNTSNWINKPQCLSKQIFL